MNETLQESHDVLHKDAFTMGHILCACYGLQSSRLMVIGNLGLQELLAQTNLHSTGSKYMPKRAFS